MYKIWMIRVENRHFLKILTKNGKTIWANSQINDIYSANPSQRPHFEILLTHCLWHWINITPALGECLLLDEILIYLIFGIKDRFSLAF